MHDIFIVDVAPGDEAASIARIRDLVAQTGARDLAFMVTAVPNEEPLADRLRDWVHRFRLLKVGLEGTPARAGLLIQALIGHGDRGRLAGEVPFQPLVGADGVVSRESFCPLDPDFQAYTTTLMTTLAREAPAFFMIDDDFRLASHDPAHRGCMCPLHLARFVEMTGLDLSREALVARFAAGDTALRTQWEELKRRSLVELAGVIRAAVDVVDPSIPGSLACVAAEVHFAQDIAETLASDHPPLVRVHNAIYLEHGLKDFPERVTRTQREIAALSPATTVLTEADTCPHNRHSLSVRSHLAHLTATTLVGCRGGKYWFIKTDEDGWRETMPFMDALKRARPFLDEVGRIRDHVTWLGPQVLGRIEEIVQKPWDQQRALDFPTDDWGWRVFGRLGIPFTVGSGEDLAGTGLPDAPRALCRTASYAFDDDELRDLLAGSLLLDGEAAWLLGQRGFGDLLGVTVDDAPFACTAEILHMIPESTRSREQTVGMTGSGRYRLTPKSVDTRVVSSFVTGTVGALAPVAPGLTWYENALGGRVAVYGLSMQAPLEWIFYNAKRKTQLIETLTWLAEGRPPVWVETDLDVFVLHGRDTSDAGRAYLCVFNLNPDTLEGLTVRFPGAPVREVERLLPDGTWAPVGFSFEDGSLHCEVSAPTLTPLILRLRTATDQGNLPRRTP